MIDNSYQGGVNGAAGLFYDDTSTLWPHVEQMSVVEFVDFLFLNALQRKASAVEKTDLQALYDTAGFTTNGGVDVRANNHDDIARITFDYISRLPEFYYFKAIN